MNTITINFGDIINEMKNKNIKICFVKDRSIFIEHNNNLYQIQIEKYGNYLDKIIINKEILDFNIIDDTYIYDCEKEYYDINKVKNFIKNVICVEYPKIKYESIYIQSLN